MSVIRLAALFLCSSGFVFGAFGFARTVTVQAAQVPSTQTNFPMLVAGTYSYLATIANGGKVANASGYDVGFYTSATCTTGKLDWETELYTAATGAVVYHVEVPSIANGTVIYLCYGDASISTDQSNKTGVYDSNYKLVWHMADNAASTVVLDSTGNANNGTAAANTSGKTVAGMIGSGLAFNGSSDFVSRADSGANVFGIVAAYTMSMWVSSTNYAQNTKFFGGIHDTGGGTGSFSLTTWSTLKGVSMTNYSTGFVNELFGSPYFVDSTAYLVHLTYDGTTVTFYAQGVSRKTLADTGSLAYAALPFRVGADAAGAALFAATYFDDVRLSNISRSADWIATEWNNQSAPASFYALGSETALATARRRISLLQ